MEVCDGVLIHSLIGNLKKGDIPAKVRIQAIETLIDHYFVKENVYSAGYPLDMRYAGPREALLHATFRQNYGVNKMIIGRDHAGVGDFYGLFEAQEIFDRIPKTGKPGQDLLCEPLKIDWTFYCKKCDGMASMRTCPHTKEDRVILSGTKLRKMLSEGLEVPDHFGRNDAVGTGARSFSGSGNFRRAGFDAGAPGCGPGDESAGLADEPDRGGDDARVWDDGADKVERGKDV